MERTNWTDIEFILQGLSEYPRAEKLLFVMCLLMYLVILLGNSTLIILTLLDSHLHTPMYFFLCNLSFLDIWYTSSFIPSMLIHFLSEKKTISFTRCVVQMSVSYTMGSTECVLLAVMAYDRYIAICNPLRYPIIMNKALCIQMAALSWGLGFFTHNALTETILAVQLPFCGKNVINHFVCEILAFVKLACTDVSLNEITIMLGNVIFLFVPLLLICISYIFILSTVLRINSAEGRKKAFSTCSAHIMVVTVFYGTILFMYMKPKSKDAAFDKLIALFYGIITPMLNPIIYSLRNTEVHSAMRKLIARLVLEERMRNLHL
ncbi:LOW QUALITY PROTEIN: olfactory receptor 13C7-like [Budorcas taxicolor]|uniref:LOW QUALITY PROTEIN: olfactory receptor 13C7-like n=1 Tax=Budorcas taxicolor TaxID=37181 RepID=UPI002284063B|nr:LOW QUALITY PROTEIN: olfactory receptor 13C7-like [Budorcas taxicolor]XP_052501238.1 LOW QUALITY PROTEIN: olfactory receptor 13C7-like [Budorcas taxicolor]